MEAQQLESGFLYIIIRVPDVADEMSRRLSWVTYKTYVNTCFFQISSIQPEDTGETLHSYLSSRPFPCVLDHVTT
jgi:hypothetical protein